MVRRLAGALVQAGRGQIHHGDFTLLLQGKSLKGLDIAASTAPASGLFLERVTYPA
jgi:tRNA U38,U39,U40 pseudouridine synthase TruA